MATKPSKKQLKNLKHGKLSDDLYFLEVMSHKQYALEMLKRLLPDAKIEKIIHSHTQYPIEINKEERGGRLDYFAVDNNNQRIDIEMQTTDDTNELGIRMMRYYALIATQSLPKGKKLTDMPTIYIVFICTFDQMKNNKVVYKQLGRDFLNSHGKINSRVNFFLYNAASTNKKGIKKNLRNLLN